MDRADGDGFAHVQRRDGDFLQLDDDVTEDICFGGESARKIKLGGKGRHGLWWSFGTITAFQFISTENFNSLFPQNAEWSRKWSENKNY